MPPKRFHEQYENDTGEGDLNIKKIELLEVKMVIVKMIQIKELRRLELLWREDIIIGTIGRSLVREYKGKRLRNMKLDELSMNF